MLITISFHDAPGTPAVKRHAQNLAAELARFFPQVVSVDWHLSKEGRAFEARLQVHARRGYYRGRAEAETFRSAMDAAAVKVRLQRTRRKDVERRERRRTTKRTLA